jgi:hypothetical protein
MSGIFPNANDGGLPPNPNDASNPARAYPPVTPPVSTAALYYGNGCDVRLRPEVVNSIISEQEALCDVAKVAYNPARQTNTQIATRSLIQRGQPRSSLLTKVTTDRYAAVLDPISIALNDYMTLSVVPTHNNEGATQINTDGKGYVPLLRDDGADIAADDIMAGMPFEIIFYQGKWYHVGLVKSQLGIDISTIQYFGLNVVIFSSGTGSFTVPEGVFALQEVELTGGGGGGGGGGHASLLVGGGGNGGMVVRGSLIVTPGQVINWAVGDGGWGGVGAGNGGNGGTTTFGTWYATGGKGGQPVNAGGAWDPSSGGQIHYSGGPGEAGWRIDSTTGAWVRGGKGGFTASGGMGGNGSQQGGTVGNPGTAPGGGGGGGSGGTYTSGGYAANGRVLIRY